VRHNALRHGLAAAPAHEDFADVEQLARELAGDSPNRVTLEFAREAASGQAQLDRVRAARIALIELVYSSSGTTPRPHFSSKRHFLRVLRDVKRFEPWIPGLDDLRMTIPANENERMAAAIRRVLPELSKLDRYEQRAFGRRDRALQELDRRR
jgi:hypothetical protein